ncbi:uncharacterized protein LOC142350685 [Convolutriloba macropyga]|uniref:uncharacterized protein LOC142350685 n=1 Tax=Convolutriloba macropyga TaxID=536237 RepID=UPI003F525545
MTHRESHTSSPHFLACSARDSNIQMGDSLRESNSNTLSKTAIGCSSLKASLECAVCQCICHQPVTIAPCFHSFCGGCLSKWYNGAYPNSRRCPTCREEIQTVSKNYHMRYFADCLRKKNVIQERSRAELKDLENSNIFRSNVTDLRNNNRQRRVSSSRSSSNWERRGAIRVSVSPRHMYISQVRTARRDRLADVDIGDLDLLTVAEVRDPRVQHEIPEFHNDWAPDFDEEALPTVRSVMVDLANEQEDPRHVIFQVFNTTE